jgi:transposase
MSMTEALLSAASWRHLPDNVGPYTTCENRLVRWVQDCVCDKNMDAFAAVHDTAVQIVETSIVRVRRHGACVTRNREQSMGGGHRTGLDRFALVDN